MNKLWEGWMETTNHSLWWQCCTVGDENLLERLRRNHHFILFIMLSCISCHASAIGSIYSYMCVSSVFLWWLRWNCGETRTLRQAAVDVSFFFLPFCYEWSIEIERFAWTCPETESSVTILFLSKCLWMTRIAVFGLYISNVLQRVIPK